MTRAGVGGSTILLSVLFLVAGAPAAHAQDAAQPAPAFVTKWNNGLDFESADGATKLEIGLLMQGDGRFALGTPPPITNTFLIRRSRFLVSARVQKYFEFYFDPDFASGTLTLFDSYIDTVFSKAARVRFGKFKSPVGLESLYADPALPFVERSIANNLVPNRDVGVTVLGDLARGRVSYVGGVLNGTPDGTNTDTDANGGKDLVGRITVHAGPGGVAVGASHGNASGAQAGFKTTAMQTFFSYASAVTANGEHNRVSPAAFVYRGPFGAFVEYFRSSLALEKGGATTVVTNIGWNATAIVVPTGERASEAGVAPKQALDPSKGQWGALQVAFRVSQLKIDPRVFSAGLAAAGASRTATEAGVSVAWYETSNVKSEFTYTRTVFDGQADGPRHAENALVFRLQLNLAPKL